jgi:uncharacterized membrane protein
MTQQHFIDAARMRKRLAWGGFWTGFALGGFFDGILLHQILQWHHLLAGVGPSGTVPDLRYQILADGVFHLVHYVFMVLGLWLIWSTRAGLAANGAGRDIIAWALIGFGSWHIIDAVVSHWMLQLHRIRMDVDNPLLWDLIWLVPFGIVTLAIGIWMLRRGSGDGAGPNGGRMAASLSLAVMVAGPIAALPPTDLLDDGMTLALFRPGLSFTDIAAATDAVGGSLVWSDASQGVWLIALGEGARPAALYRHGALMVSNGSVAVGCLSWMEI